MPITYFLNSPNFVTLDNGILMSLSFFYGIALASLGPLSFHMIIGTGSQFSLKKTAGILSTKLVNLEDH